MCATCLHHDKWHDVTRDMYTLAQIDNSNHLMNKTTTDSEQVHLWDVAGRLQIRLEAFPDTFFGNSYHSGTNFHSTRGVTLESELPECFY